MEIIKALKKMNNEEREVYIKAYLEKLKEAKAKCGNDKKKIQELGKKLNGKEEEIIAILLLTMIDKQYWDDFLELYELIEGVLTGYALKKGLSIANIFGIKLPFK